MDPSTELASDFTVARYHELREPLTATPPNDDAWREVISAVQRRIEERFLVPVKELARFDDADELPYRPGFAILALDCLLIDTIQSFREGRVTTGDVSPAHSFKTFLSSPRFSDFTSNDRGEFFQYVRNGILHNGETRKDWKIRIDTERMLERDPITKTRTINRQHFHAAIREEFEDLIALLRSRNAAAREVLLRRLDAMAGLPIDALRNYYFAYGSNLNDGECRRTAPNAKGYGVAFLPGHRLAFTKHSINRQGDAATINEDPNSIVWGYVYRVTDNDREALRKREGGYEEAEVTVYLTPPTPGDDPTLLHAFTFVALSACPRHCGPPRAYLDLITAGAEERQLPDEYQQALRSRR
jgi:gamma-glutamylcyclotransferase